jgi:hypothetical protein
MSLIPISQLSASELAHLGNNVPPVVRLERREAKAVGHPMASQPRSEFRPVYAGQPSGDLSARELTVR